METIDGDGSKNGTSDEEEGGTQIVPASSQTTGR